MRVAGHIEGVDLDAAFCAMRAGDERAAGLVFRRLQPDLLRYLRRHEPLVADDLAAEVWLAAARGMDGFAGDASGLRRWLFTVARRRVIEHRRRKTRRPVDPVEHSRLVESPSRTLATERAALELLAAAEIDDLLRETLTPAQEAVVRLRILADLDVATAAERLKRPESWVRVTQHRALRRLAHRLAPKPLVTPGAADAM